MARKTVLDAVRDALADAVVPPLPRLARASAAPDRHVLAARFAREAGTVGTIVHEVEGLGARTEETRNEPAHHRAEFGPGERVGTFVTRFQRRDQGRLVRTAGLSGRLVR